MKNAFVVVAAPAAAGTLFTVGPLATGTTLSVPFLVVVAAGAFFPTASLGVAVLGYGAWALGVEPPTWSAPWLVLSIIPVLFAAAWTQRRIVTGHGGDPTELLLSERALHLAGAVAVACVISGLYLT